MSGKTRSRERESWITGEVIVGLALILLVAVAARLAYPPYRPAPTIPNTPTVSDTPTLAPNPYSPADFVWEDGFPTCVSGESILGVDVSEYQGSIDWEQVARSGVGVAMVRLGARAWGSKGELLTDSRGLENLQGAAEAGLMTGVYFFSQAITEEEAREEARFVLKMLDGRRLQMPVVFDWEFAPDADARTAKMTGKMLNACAIAFCEEIRAAGYRPMIYFNFDLADRMLDLLRMQEQGYEFWLAWYSQNMICPYRVDMWQYTYSGRISGIRGDVDLNLYFVYPEGTA